MDADVLAQLLDSHTWRQNVALYRKWEQRRDRSVNPDLRTKFGNELGRQYMTLSNAAREIVILAHKDKAKLHNRDDQVNFLDDSTVRYERSPRFQYKLKWTTEQPLKLWFQRHEHEPWFELGYLDKVNLRWYDTEAQLKEAVMTEVNSFGYKDRQLDIRRAQLDQAREMQDRLNELKNLGRLPAEPILTGPAWADVKRKILGHAYGAHTDHVHIGRAIDMTVKATPLNTEGIDPMYSENPEDLEAAAAHAMARAAELRAIDEREPDGEEPTISWTHPGELEPDTLLTYVAFKANNGRWYETAHKSVPRGGKTWRELVAQPHARALREGTFLIVGEWVQA